MTMVRVRVAALWVIAAVLLASSAWFAWSYADVTAVMYVSTDSGGNGVTITDADYRWSQFLSILPVPLLVSGILAVMMALVVHAVLWRRARTTPPGT